MRENIRQTIAEASAEIDKLTARYQKVWQEIADIESPTKDKAGVDRVGRYIAGIAEEFGWDVEYNRQEISGDALCITMNPGAQGALVVLSSHMDTVHPVGSFGTPPTRIEGDLLYGPGVTDCKGGIVSALLAMHALQNIGFSARPVRLLLQSDEETSSLGSRKGTVRFMAEKSKDAVAFLNGETFFPGKVTVARKGIVRLIFTVKGRAAHSSLCYNGASAIAEAAHKILALEAYKDPDGITCSCGTIQGGTADNVVPDTVIFTVDVRLPDAAAYEQVLAFCREIAEHSYIEGTSCTFEVKSYRTPMELLPKTLPLLAEVNRIFSEVGLPELKGVKREGGSDAADMAAAGIPALDSLGTAGDRIHNPGEFGYLSSLAESAHRLAALVCALPDEIPAS